MVSLTTDPLGLQPQGPTAIHRRNRRQRTPPGFGEHLNKPPRPPPLRNSTVGFGNFATEFGQSLENIERLTRGLSRSDETLYKPSFANNAPHLPARSRTGGSLSVIGSFGGVGGGYPSGSGSNAIPHRVSRRRAHVSMTSDSIPQVAEQTRAFYEEQLNRQIEEKRRLAEIAAFRKKEEDEREERRVQQEVDKINREYQAEQAAREKKEQQRRNRYYAAQSRQQEISNMEVEKEKSQKSRRARAAPLPEEGRPQPPMPQVTPKGEAEMFEPHFGPAEMPDFTAAVSGLSAFGDIEDFLLNGRGDEQQKQTQQFPGNHSSTGVAVGDQQPELFPKQEIAFWLSTEKETAAIIRGPEPIDLLQDKPPTPFLNLR